CCLGWFRRYVPAGRYVGVDGTASAFADRVADLRHYTSATDGVLIRHVLEHDHGWRRILDNAVASFGRKMCLVLFTPLAAKTHVTHEEEIGPGRVVPFYRFRKADLTRRFGDVCDWREEQVGSETVFYLWK